jgi:beta-glucosidase
VTGLPAGFLWGASTAAHQIEGGNVTADLWAVERAPGTIFAEPSGDACDSYHRYGEDVALLADAGLNAYRFSVEWARIEPEEGFFSRAALDHYRRVAGACLERGVTPVVTYHHFTSPRWFSADGGWAADTAPDRFARYAERVSAHLGDLVPWVCTINEANIAATLVHVGIAPAGERSEPPPAPDTDGPPAFPGFPLLDVERMALAHRKATEAVKSGPGAPQVGWSLALIDLQATDGGEQRRDRARQLAQLDWLDVSAGDDYVGVQTYTRERFGPGGLLPVPEGTPTTLTGWEVYPEALEHTIRLAADRTGIPVVVTENGMATADDEARIAYTTEALRGLGRCLADGIDVRGYLHWSLLDNFEWTAGYRPTFGLVAVDRTTFARTAKPSLAWLGELGRTRRLP